MNQKPRGWNPALITFTSCAGTSTHTLKFENGGLDGAESFCSAPGAGPAAISSLSLPPQTQEIVILEIR